MTFRERASVAWKVAVGLFDENSLRQTGQFLNRIYPGARGEPPVRGTRDRLLAYSTMPWLRACAERVANSIASTQWQLFIQRKGGKPVTNRTLKRASYDERVKILKELRDRGELEEIQQHVLLDQVLDRGNAYLTGHAMQKITQLHLDLAGETFWLKERDGFRTVVGAWPIPPDWVIATPTPSHRVFDVSFRGWNGDIPDTEIFWMANPDPSNPYGRGTGLTGAIADDLEIDEYIRRQTKQTFFNGAQPPFIVYPKGHGSEPGQWSETEVRRAERKWLDEHQGFWKKAKPLFSTRELGIFEFSQDMQLQAAPLREQERNVIMQTWGVPPEIMGVVENSNRATAQAADYIYERYVLQTRREFLRTQMQERLIPEYDERLVLHYVDVVPRDKEYELEVAKVAPWTLTLNQWLAMQGQPMVTTDEGKLRMVPIGLQAVGDLNEAQPPEPSADPGRPMIPEPDEDDAA